MFLGLVCLSCLTVATPEEDPEVKANGVAFENRGLELLKNKFQEKIPFGPFKVYFFPTYLKVDKVITQLDQIINNYNEWEKSSSLKDFTKLVYDSYYRTQHMINWLEKRKGYPGDEFIGEKMIMSQIELGFQSFVLNKIGEVVQEMSTLTDQLDIDVEVGFLKHLNPELNEKMITALSNVNSLN